ncbi:MAG TPA: transposase [Kofleriaceae bacterium]|jgi:REP element-mobilizing transposase RayT
MQGELPFKTWGGKRAGAGRPKQPGRASERHEVREEVRASWPVHVTMRVGRGLYLRNHKIWRAIARAASAAAKRGAIHIVHASVQHDHVHILVEASDQYALAKGMHAFEISAAHWINVAAKRRGRVFPDRYHAHVLKTPREVRSAIRYVLSNWRKHGEDGQLRCAVDPFSTGYAFWPERAPRDYEPLPTAAPRSWLLSEGWQLAGAISPYETPGRARS